MGSSIQLCEFQQHFTLRGPDLVRESLKFVEVLLSERLAVVHGCFEQAYEFVDFFYVTGIRRRAVLILQPCSSNRLSKGRVELLAQALNVSNCEVFQFVFFRCYTLDHDQSVQRGIPTFSDASVCRYVSDN